MKTNFYEEQWKMGCSCIHFVFVFSLKVVIGCELYTYQTNPKEVQVATDNLKSNKLCGIDGIPGELLKYSGHRLLLVLNIAKFWLFNSGTMQTFFLSTNTHKNSHETSLLSFAGKMLVQVLLTQILQDIFNIVPLKKDFGFCSGSSKIDMNFTAHLIQEKFHEQHCDQMSS